MPLSLGTYALIFSHASESYIRTTEEASQRENTWNELNRDYIEKQAEKQRIEEMKESALPHEKQGKRKRRALDNSVSRTAHEVLRAPVSVVAASALCVTAL